MNIFRFGGSGITAAIVTFGLIVLMVTLIESGHKAPEDKEEIKIVDIVMPAREIETQYDAVKPEKVEDPQEQPPELPEPQFDAPAVSDAVNISAPKADAGIKRGGLGIAGGDGDYLPLVQIPPRYPSRAQSAQIEGYVIIGLTVTPTGAVKDPYIIEGWETTRRGKVVEPPKPTKVFNSSALKAVKKFKYKPRLVDGVAEEVPGVKYKMKFAFGK